MIALLRGILMEKHPNQAIVEAGGVGYDVNIPVSTFTRLPEAGCEVRLRIHTHVREDALALYGFLTEDEKALFEKLIGVSGIGPTLAVKILSGLAAPDLITPSGAAKWTTWCAFRAWARRPPSAWFWNCATSCRRRPGRKPGAPRRGGAFAGGSGRAFGAAQPGLRAPAGRSRGAQGQGRRARRTEFEPLFRRALELVR